MKERIKGKRGEHRRDSRAQEGGGKKGRGGEINF